MSDPKDDELYGVGPMQAALPGLRAFNALPINSDERRQAVRDEWPLIVAEEQEELDV